ncbi:sugar ABC transporter permease [Propioniciclava sp.]|uniref:carbohydrate ABC transporter permease n=1 Tax=Propioniciclava sp. TaxID=2038686 RepID=UPI002617F193|nr:sugar ABC transporter permease [Propioniciclava sp.]
MSRSAAGPRSSLTTRQRLSKLDVATAPYVYIAPFFLLFAVIGLFPMLFTAYVSTRQYGLLTGDAGPAGFDNYAFILTNERFLIGLRNTFSIFLLSSVPQVIAAIFIAAVLNANLRARTFWRMGVLLPYVVAPVAVSLIFGRLFADQSGVINTLLGGMGIPPIGWHADVLPSHLAIATMVNFRWTGYNTLIFLAAMQAIPRDVIEAAIVDGASRWRTFWNVTLPMLRPTVMFVVITSTIGGLQIFDEPRMYDSSGLGGNDRQWMTIAMYMYELGWGPQRNLGRASAVAWILFAIVVLFALLNFWLTSRIANSGTDAPRRRGRPGRKVAP